MSDLYFIIVAFMLPVAIGLFGGALYDEYDREADQRSFRDFMHWLKSPRGVQSVADARHAARVIKGRSANTSL